ncbi:MAG: 23S rRNA (uracil(1939)-C(5))-methyltransferase RlmD [Desulfobulbaceae bacterium]|nr:23S rRNA (uracil(1939)-C(5))-methyltransferase RlmD [Desulfobulbaceae bacterium]
MNHRIRIEKIVTGGFGLARLPDGLVVLTRYVIPGETVLVREVARHRGYIEALPVEIIDSPQNRAAPPCPYFTACGGCDFQHIEISSQHHIKTEMIRESLQRAGVAADNSVVHPLLPSPLPYGYRFRIRLQAGPEGQLGFFRTGSNDLVPVSRCLLATDPINRALRELRSSDTFSKIAADISEIELLQNPADNRVVAVLHLHRKAKAKTSQFSAFAVTLETISDLVIKKGKKISSPVPGASPVLLQQDFDSSICGRSFSLSWSPGCFFQVNVPHNRNLIAQVCREYVRTGRGRTVLDLYCGMGNFSIPIALCGAEVTGIEHNPESIKWSVFNARQAGLDRCSFLADDVGRRLQDFLSRSQGFEVILVDPPRQGLGKHTPLLAALKPETIIYVSCDPATLARDLAALTKSGYRISSLTPVDMFPQTHHIESVALLEKN